MRKDIPYRNRAFWDSKGKIQKSHSIRRSLPVAVFVAYLLLSFFNAIQAQEIRAPKLSLSDDMFDFKEVIEGETITHSFRIQNKGNDTLKVLRVSPG